MDKPTLLSLLSESLEALGQRVAAQQPPSSLSGIGFVTDDQAAAIAAFLRFEGDFPLDAEPFLLLSPVEWLYSEDEAFKAVNAHLQSEAPEAGEAPDQYQKRVSSLFGCVAEAVEVADLRGRYGDGLYLTFAGVDPNETLERAEEDFIARLNPESVLEQWREEFG